MSEKIENLDNAVEFLLLKALFYTLQSLRISNKIKQLHHLLKTMRIFAWSRNACICRGNTQVYLQFFCKSKLQSTQKGRAAMQMHRAVLQVKFRFMSKRPTIRKHSVVVTIAVNSISFFETAICREIFSKYLFASIANFQKVLAAHQNTFLKVLQTSQKYTRGEVLCQ